MPAAWLLRRQAWILIALGPALLFGPMLVSGRALFWGTPLLQFVPWRGYAYQMLSYGHLPLWNPLVGMGAPLLANYQSGLFYPPHVLLPIVGPAWGHGLLVMLHLVWAGAGTLLLTRRLGITPLGQIISALSYSLSGYMIARAGFLSINAAAAWLPWAVLAVDQLIESPRGHVRAATALALVLAMQWLAGHAQTAWYSLLFASAWAAWRGWSGGRAAGVIRAGARFSVAGVWALSLAAVQLLPTAEYLAESSRAGTLDREFALTYSLWPWRLLGFLLPDLFGSPARGDYWGYGNYWEDAVYIGALPFMLALLAIVAAAFKKGSHRNQTLFLAFCAVVSIVFALGQNTPIYLWLFERVPTFALFQAPARWSLIAVFVLSILAGLGANAWRRPSGRRLYWVRLGVAGAGAMGLVALGAGYFLPWLERSFIRAFLMAGLALTIAGVLTLRKTKATTSRWTLMVSLIVLADLVYAHWGLNPSVPLSVYRGQSRLESQGGAGHRYYIPGDVEYEAKFQRSFRFETFDPGIDWRSTRDAGIPNTPMLDGLASANNFDPILPSRYVKWLEAVDRLPLGRQAVALALMDVGWVGRIHEGSVLGVTYEPVPFPARVRMVGDAVWVDSPEEALQRVLAPDVAHAEVVILEGEPPPGAATTSAGTAAIRPRSDPNSILIAVSSPAGGWLVLSDAWYPGWSAKVGQDEVEIYRANYLFRAVRVPPGEHEVEFRYTPRSFAMGAAASLIGWAALGLVSWRWRRS